MKKLLFAGGIIFCLLTGCSSSKNMSTETFTPPSPPENYFQSPNALSEADAIAMIKGFIKHKHHCWGKKHLLNTWAMFDRNDLSKVINNPNVDTIKFALAAWKAKGKNYPTVIMVVVLNNSVVNSVNQGDNGQWKIVQVADRDSRFLFNRVQYLKPGNYCPPPEGCMLVE